jgi:ubiquitin C-terminal hydrolase
VINHQGTVDFGHYFTYIKFYHKEDWYEFNDSQVKYIGKNIESFPYAYALFYAKI